MSSVQKTEKLASRNDLRLNFSEALRSALVVRFGKIPSATHFSNQFNFRAHGTATISRETARKWMNGQAIPEMPKLNVLMEWLDIDTNKFLSHRKTSTQISKTVSDDDLIIQTIAELLRQMDAKTRSVVLITAWALRESHSTPVEPLNLQALKRTLLRALTATDND